MPPKKKGTKTSNSKTAHVLNLITTADDESPDDPSQSAQQTNAQGQPSPAAQALPNQSAPNASSAPAQTGGHDNAGYGGSGYGRSGKPVIKVDMIDDDALASQIQGALSDQLEAELEAQRPKPAANLGNFPSMGMPSPSAPTMAEQDAALPMMPQGEAPPPMTSQSEAPPPMMSQSEAPPPVMSQSEAPPPVMSQTEAPPPVMPQTEVPPPVMPQTEVPPPVMSQTEVPPPVMPQTEAPPPVMPQTEAPPPVMPQTEVPPPVMPQTEAPPPVMSQNEVPPPVMTQTEAPPPVMPPMAPPPPVAPPPPPAATSLPPAPPPPPPVEYAPPSFDSVPETAVSRPEAPVAQEEFIPMPPVSAVEELPLELPLPAMPPKGGSAPMVGGPQTGAPPSGNVAPSMPPMPSSDQLKPFVGTEQASMPPSDILDAVDSSVFVMHNHETALSNQIQDALVDQLTLDFPEDASPYAVNSAFTDVPMEEIPPKDTRSATPADLMDIAPPSLPDMADIVPDTDSHTQTLPPLEQYDMPPQLKDIPEPEPEVDNFIPSTPLPEFQDVSLNEGQGDVPTSIFLDPILPPEVSGPASISLEPSIPLELGDFAVNDQPLELEPLLPASPAAQMGLPHLAVDELVESDVSVPEATPDLTNPMVGRKLGEPVEYYNLTEILVREMAPRFLQTFGTCTCEQCLLDVIAHCLSQLPPKYVVRYQSAYGTIYEDYKRDESSTIVSQLGKSCIAINEKPRHLKAFMGPQ